ncbi:MAG: glycosyltransferase family 2 protein [Clostridia bacterium]|nr:glycosyltransferase family 2 protein [Clostridia bacterium]
MSLISNLKNLRAAASRFGKDKWKRAMAMISDYGVREFARRVVKKMHGEGFYISTDGYVLTNEAFLAPDAPKNAFHPERMVSFRIGPGGENIAKFEILTANPGGDEEARLRLEVFADGERLLDVSSGPVAHEGYTQFVFPEIGGVQQKPLDFVVSSTSDACGILVDRKKSLSGITVQGGGRVAARLYMHTIEVGYDVWLSNNVLSEEALESQRQADFTVRPKFSIVVPLYNTKEPILRAMIDSVRAQTYDNWELCLADGSTDRTRREAIIASYNDPRLRYRRLETNSGISGNTNEAIAMAEGDFVAFLDHDDMIAPQALYTYARIIESDGEVDFLYSDEDKIDEAGRERFDPYFKPDFSPYLLLSFNYITHFSVIRRSLLEEIGPLDSRFDGAQDYDFILRATEKARKVAHAPDVLYHWRVTAQSTAMNWKAKAYTIEAGQRAVEAALNRRGIEAEVLPHRLPNTFTVIFPVPDPEPLVSIIIPSHNETQTLRTCISSILGRRGFENYEILIVENNSTDAETFRYYEEITQEDPRVRVLTWNHPFNYASINNWAAEQARGDLLLFLNNDVEVISPDWLAQMTSLAVRPDVGAVGAKLLYPDRTIQHGGVVIRIGGIAGHSHKGVTDDTPGYYLRMCTVHDLSAVTAACLMTRADVFREVGGFDEEFVLAFNDVDLCLRIREAGYSVLFAPQAELFHYESKTRGYEVTREQQERFLREQRAWLRRWMDKYPGDPFYNPNLTYQREQYQIDGGRTGTSLEMVTRPYDALMADERKS